jgi:hypothetical protein
MNWSRDCGESGYFSADPPPGGPGPQRGMTERRRDRAAMDKYAVGGPSPVDVPLAQATRKRRLSAS